VGRRRRWRTAKVIAAVQAALSLPLFLEATWLNVPLTQAFAIAAVIMTGSLLVPIEPIDGAKLGKAGVLAAAGVIGSVVLIVVGVA